MWGNGKQTRSFCYIDDAVRAAPMRTTASHHPAPLPRLHHRALRAAQVEGILRLMVSDYQKPLNIGSDEMVSMNQMADMVMEISQKKLPIRHIPGPEGVRGRNSENTLIKEKLGWEPDTPLAEGLKITYDWIKSKVDEAGGDAARFSSSKVCGVQAPTAMGELRAADGKETTL